MIWMLQFSHETVPVTHPWHLTSCPDNSNLLHGISNLHSICNCTNHQSLMGKTLLSLLVRATYLYTLCGANCH